MEPGEKPQAQEQFLYRVATELVVMTAAVIVTASDDVPEAREGAAKLPAVVQVEALAAVLAMTIHDSGTIKNLLATVGQALAPPPSLTSES
jgi:hypothetical protein